MREALLKILLLGAAATCSGDQGAGVEFHGDASPGLAYYGIQHPDWPCEESLRVLRGVKEPKLSILWNSFGTREACLRKFLADPRRKVLEIHLINECCIRRRWCAEYEFAHGHSVDSYERAVRSKEAKFVARLEAYLQKPAALMQEFRGPNLVCLISLGLESNLSPQGMEQMLKWIKPQFPGCRFVSHGRRVKNAKFVEHHVRHKPQPPCILANDDGKWPPASLASWRAAGDGCRAFFIWHPQYNGWAPSSLVGGPNPRGRTNWPDAEVFRWTRAQFP